MNSSIKILIFLLLKNFRLFHGVNSDDQILEMLETNQLSNKTNPFINPEQQINDLDFIEIAENIENECPIENCPDIHEPVCGFDGSCFRSFHNPCEVSRENCNRSWFNKFNITYNTVCNPDDKPTCDTCSAKCIKESKPFCAYNKFCYQTFYGLCQMFRQDCISGGIDMFEVFAEGKCTDDQMPICRESCPKSCQHEFSPVCGKKDKCYQSFYNQCYLDRTNCLLEDGTIEFNFLHNGNCFPEEMLESTGC